jgi:hypothetical protein
MDFQKLKNSYRVHKKKYSLVLKPFNVPKYKKTYKTIIIVPFRDNKFQDRKEQLDKFIPYFQKLFKGSIDILVVEQSEDNRKFNRGALLNIGMLLAMARGYKVMISHDVDLLPDKIAKEYYLTYPFSPIHLGNMWKEKYTYDRFIGGAMSMNQKDIIKSNGYPNDFWGWGGEDDALGIRLSKENISILKPQNGIIREMKHEDTKKIKELRNLTFIESVMKDNNTWKNNGVNSVKFKKLDDFKYNNNASKITVEIL